MDGQAVSDADLLNILQGFNKTKVKAVETESIDTGNENTKSEQRNTEDIYVPSNQTKQTATGDSGAERFASEMNKVVKLETFTKNDVAPGNIKEDVEDLFTTEDFANNAKMTEDLTNNSKMTEDITNKAKMHGDFTNNSKMYEDFTNNAKMYEDFTNNSKMYVSQDDFKDTAKLSASMDDLSDNSFANLSLHVNETELDMFNECSKDEGKGNSQMDGVEVSKEESALSDIKGLNVKPSESPLHCAICNNYFERPKLLECLHTFCQSCLMKGVKRNHKFIFCRMCTQRSNIPKGGIKKLPDNVVAASQVMSKAEREECMICKLRNEVNTATSRCLDCGDILCQDCSNNHTFSRITAKHIVVPIEQAKSGSSAKSLPKASFTYCERHSDVTGEYFCLVCCVPVCDECKQSDHRSHKCDIIENAVSGKRELLKSKLENFELECVEKLMDDTDESRSLISEHRKKEFEKLESVKDTLIEIVDKKYSKCLKQLEEEFAIKMRKYCKHKKTFVKNLSTEFNQFEENVLFLLNEGNDLEAAMLENTISMALGDKRIQLGKVHPKLTEQSPFPEVKIFKEHAEIMQGMTFFCSNQNYLEQKRKERCEKMEQSEIYSETGVTRMKVGKKFKN